MSPFTLEKIEPTLIRKESSRLPLPLWKIIGILALSGMLAIAWIRKENYHDQLSRQILSLEKQESQTLNQTGYLQQEYLQLTEPTRLEQIARQRLNMLFPAESPDTIWSSKPITPDRFKIRLVDKLPGHSEQPVSK